MSTGRCSIFYFKFSKLLMRKAKGVLIIRAMIAYNDLATINYLNRKAGSAKDIPYDIAQYNRHWTLRMLAMTLDEALQIIHDIAKSSNFQRVLALPEMRAQLKRLQPVLPGGCESDLFKSRIADQRDWIGAHLDERAIERAMHYRASFPRRDIGKIEFSTSPWCTRMYGAEDILTTIVVRHAWDLMQEGDELEALGAERAGWFTGVAADVELFLAQLMVGLKELQEI